MPHIVSTKKQFATINNGSRVEAQQQKIIDYVNQEMSHIVYLDDKLIDPTHSLKQLGRPLTSQEFEVRLGKILPSNCIFIDNPYNPTKKAIIRLLGINKSETLVPYERGYIPEHSVMQLVEKEVPDIDVLARRKSINRKDLPKHEYVPGEGFVFDDTVTRPGFKKIKQVGREIQRGWRTVLIKLILQNIITITEAESVFGTDNAPGWSQHLGKTSSHLVPW